MQLNLFLLFITYLYGLFHSGEYRPFWWWVQYFINLVCSLNFTPGNMSERKYSMGFTVKPIGIQILFLPLIIYMMLDKLLTLHLHFFTCENGDNIYFIVRIYLIQIKHFYKIPKISKITKLVTQPMEGLAFFLISFSLEWCLRKGTCIWSQTNDSKNSPSA